MLRNFSVAISVSSHVCFILVLILISMFLKQCVYELGFFHANRTTKKSTENIKQVTVIQRETNIGQLVTFNAVSGRRRRKEILKIIG